MDPDYLDALRRNFALRLDRLGRFWYEDALIEHPRVDAFFRRALDLSPNGEPIVEAAHPTKADETQWAYLTVEDTLLRVSRLAIEGPTIRGLLDDTRWVEIEPESMVEDERGLRCAVPTARHGRPATARLSNAAAAALAPLLEEAANGDVILRLGERAVVLETVRDP